MTNAVGERISESKMNSKVCVKGKEKKKMKTEIKWNFFFILTEVRGGKGFFV